MSCGCRSLGRLDCAELEGSMDKQSMYPRGARTTATKRGQNRSSSKFERKSCSAQVNSFSIPLMQMHRRRIPKAPPLLLLHMAPQRIAPTECLSTPSNHQHPVVLEHLPGVSAGSPSRATFGVRGSHDNNREYRAGTPPNKVGTVWFREFVPLVQLSIVFSCLPRHTAHLAR